MTLAGKGKRRGSEFVALNYGDHEIIYVVGQHHLWNHVIPVIACQDGRIDSTDVKFVIGLNLTLCTSDDQTSA